MHRAFEVLVVHDRLVEHLGGERREEEEEVHNIYTHIYICIYTYVYTHL
jgi:hypothetical protein